jgi:hypothetical protein
MDYQCDVCGQWSEYCRCDEVCEDCGATYYFCRCDVPDEAEVAEGDDEFDAATRLIFAAYNEVAEADEAESVDEEVEPEQFTYPNYK